MQTPAHRKFRMLPAVFALAAGLGFSPPSSAAEPTPSPRPAGAAPRIGLALSGGGARGLAHIGVLKVLEELRVPVSCVTGTSIGSIVGGSFASGSSPEKLESIVLKTDWNSVFTDRPPRQEIASRRKEDDFKTLFAPELGLKDGKLVLPKGVIAGVSIEAYFRELTQAAVGTSDFNRLPIPFHAVASDIETGEAVVLDRGSVAQAMRASMAIPGAIAPVEINGKLLVDGGIANNLPIDEVRRLCADVVIAVNIGTPPLKREELTSAVSVTFQLINFLGKANVDRQIKSLRPGQDILIEPDLGDISAASFQRAEDAIKIGENAARAVAGELQRYSLPPAQYAELRRRQVAEGSGPGTVDEIRFSGTERTNPEVLRSLVQSKPGVPLTEAQISEDLRRIYGRGDFEGIDYRIQQDPGNRVMVIEPREKSWGPDYLRFGLGIATDFSGQNVFNILASYRRTWLNRLGGEWLVEGQIGRDTHLFSEFYQPVDERGRYFVAPYGMIGESTRYVFAGDARIAEYQINEGRVGVDAGAALGTLGEFRIGPIWRTIDAKVDTGSPVLPSLRETSAGMRAKLFIDQLDHAFFARRGYYAGASLYVADAGFGSDRNYKRGEANVNGVTTRGAHTFNASLAAGSDFGSDMPAYDTFSLGGPLKLSGYSIGQFAGQDMAFARLMYYNRTIPLPDLFGTGLYAGASLEAGKVRNRFDITTTRGVLYSGSVFVGADTFLGPTYFGVGAGESGHWSIYLLLGAP